MKLVVRMGCGLGNQMYEFARAFKMARAENRDLYLDLTDFYVSRMMRIAYRRKYELEAFPNVAAIAKRLNFLWMLVTIPLYTIRSFFGARIFTNILTAVGIGYLYDRIDAMSSDSFLGKRKKIVLLSGMCTRMSELPSRKECRALFSVSTSDFDAGFWELDNTVSVHIRRTDYVELKETLSMRYYEVAMEEMDKRIDSPKWIFFSDDIEWCKGQFSKTKNAIFIEGDWNKPVQDLILMSKCKHHIIANSTFSWWAAYLGNDSAITMYPGTWLDDCARTEIVPNEWIPVNYACSCG